MEQKKHWQSFGELNNSEAFNKEVKDEFTSELPMVEDHSGFLSAKAPRRDFLKYVGFSTAAAAVAAAASAAGGTGSMKTRLSAAGLPRHRR